MSLVRSDGLLHVGICCKPFASKILLKESKDVNLWAQDWDCGEGSPAYPSRSAGWSSGAQWFPSIWTHSEAYGWQAICKSRDVLTTDTWYRRLLCVCYLLATRHVHSELRKTFRARRRFMICFSFIFKTVLCKGRGRDCVVFIAIRCGLDGPGIESRWGKDFQYPSTPAPRQPRLLYNGYRVYFPGIKGEAGAWLSSPNSFVHQGRLCGKLYPPPPPSPPCAWHATGQTSYKDKQNSFTPITVYQSQYSVL